MLYYIRDDNNHLIGFEYKNTRYYYQKNIQEDISLITSIKILIGMQIIQIVWEENLKVMGKFLHFGTDENENYKKVKKYLNMPYPKYTHIMQLDDSFDYLGSICLKFLRNKKFLGKIITFEEFEEKKSKPLLNKILMLKLMI